MGRGFFNLSQDYDAIASMAAIEPWAYEYRFNSDLDTRDAIPRGSAGGLPPVSARGRGHRPTV